MPDHARQLTPAECRSRLYQHLGGLLVYWRDLQENQLLAGNPDGDITHERLTGLLFSILAAIDGSALSLPQFHLRPVVTMEDEEFAIANRQVYWPRAPINVGVEMHAEFRFDAIPRQASKS